MNNTDQTVHQLDLNKVYPSGAIHFQCPTCDYEIIVQHPGKHIVLDHGGNLTVLHQTKPVPIQDKDEDPGEIKELIDLSGIDFSELD